MNKADPGETQPGGCDFCPPPVCQLQKEYTRRVSFSSVLLHHFANFCDPEYLLYT